MNIQHAPIEPTHSRLPTTLSVEFCEDADEMFSRQELWDTLYDSSDASPFASLEWLSSCWNYFRDERKALFGIVYDADIPISIVPLEIIESPLGPVRYRVLRMLFGDWQQKAGIAVKPGYDEFAVFEYVLQQSAASGHPWDYAYFVKWPTAKLGQVLTAIPDDAPFKRVVRKTGPTVIIEIPASWDEYAQSISSAQRRHIARKTNALKRLGKIRYERVGMDSPLDTAKLQRLMEDAVAVSQHSWQHTAREGWAISDPETGGFFQEVSERLGRRNMIDLSVLYLNDAPVSFIWGTIRQSYLFLYKPGFVESLAKASPGVVHLAMHIQDSIERGSLELDYGPSHFDYKSSWGKKYNGLCTLYYYRNSLKSSILRTVRHRRHMDEIILPGPVS
jgi:CelD/BcsL family acetyltransferase involved in cellulose biosynthesis